MDEGGYEGFELQEQRMELEEYRNQYGNLDRKILDDMYGELEEVQMDNPKYSESRRRMEYIDRIRGEAETSFINEIAAAPSKYDARTFNSSITRDRKDFLSNHLGVDVRVRDGHASKELIHKMKIIFGVNGKPSAIDFDGTNVVVSRERGKTFIYSTDKKTWTL